jgi:uncharacterized protein YvpB
MKKQMFKLLYTKIYIKAILIWISIVCIIIVVTYLITIKYLSFHDSLDNNLNLTQIQYNQVKQQNSSKIYQYSSTIHNNVSMNNKEEDSVDYDSLNKIDNFVKDNIFLSVPNIKQERNLSCEFQAAANLANYYDWNITWKDVFLVVGFDTEGDPNRGFVGYNINDTPGNVYPRGYGVYAEPLARGLRRLGIQAQAHFNKDIDWLKIRLNQGHPVIVWSTYKMKIYNTIEWKTKYNSIVKGVPYEHTFIVIGYDKNGVFVNDTFDATTQYYDWQTFDKAWSLLDRMALTIDEKLKN